MNVKEETNIKNEIRIALIKYMFDFEIPIGQIPDVIYHDNTEKADAYVLIRDSIHIKNVQKLTERTIDGYRIIPTFIHPCTYEDHDYVKIDFDIKKVA